MGKEFTSLMMVKSFLKILHLPTIMISMISLNCEKSGDLSFRITLSDAYNGI